ncbi:MAG TPA: 2'-5' RNA ligase family protein [Roseivirga sp.]
MKEGVCRYFLAIIPPDALAEKVTALKNEFVERFNSRAALRSPAHITLHMPFQWKEAKEEKLFHLLAQTTNFKPFTIKLDGFGAFSPRTIFIQPQYSAELELMNTALLQTTKRELNLLHAIHIGGYHPHMTIAFRDLRKAQFFEAWPDYENREFKGTFEVNSYWLLKHNGKFWEAYREFKFTA